VGFACYSCWFEGNHGSTITAVQSYVSIGETGAGMVIGVDFYSPFFSAPVVPTSGAPQTINFATIGFGDQIHVHNPINENHSGSNIQPTPFFNFTGSYSSTDVQVETGYSTLTALSTNTGTGSPTVTWTQRTGGVQNFGATQGTISGAETVTFSTTPTISTATRSSIITLTGNITTFTLAAGRDGQEKTIIMCEDATGGRTALPPSNVLNFMALNTVPNFCNATHLTYSGVVTAWVADGRTSAYMKQSINIGTTAIAAGTCSIIPGSAWTPTIPIGIASHTGWSWAGDPGGTVGQLQMILAPTAAGTVVGRMCNTSATSITPASQLFNWWVEP
jgi:hypothetical protein